MGGVKRVNLEGGCVSSRGAMSREGLGPGGATRVAVEGASWLLTERWSMAVGGSSQLVVRTWTHLGGCAPTQQENLTNSL